jgi:hypothetical protein
VQSHGRRPNDSFIGQEKSAIPILRWPNMAGRAPVIPKKSKTESLPLEEQIRERAHAIYLERGGQDGDEMDDWLQAEQEILDREEHETPIGD